MSRKSRKLELLDGFCHSERSRGISSYLTLQMIRDVSTTLDMTNDESRWQLFVIRISSLFSASSFNASPARTIRHFLIVNLISGKQGGRRSHSTLRATKREGSRNRRCCDVARVHRVGGARLDLA